jgi:hypothetical protein
MIRVPFLCPLLLAGLAMVTTCAAAGESQPKSGKKARVLMITQSKGFEHGSVKRKGEELAPAEVAMIQLGQQSGLFTVDASQDAAADFTKENLQKYDIVMFYTTGDLPIKEGALEYFLNDWLKQKGHGFIGFHSASDTYHEYKPYWDMVGGTFNGHPWNANAKVTITVHDPEFPAMQPFGKEFEFTDEIYQYKNWQPEKVKVLMSLNMAKTDLKKPYHVPVAWAKAWGNGKVYYNNLGHNERTWTDSRFLESTQQAVRWILGLEEGDATPNPKLSQAQDEKAKRDAGPQ